MYPRYSSLAVIRKGLTRNKRWTPVWHSAAPKPAYDIVTIGVSGHGLATAYYLTSKHRINTFSAI